MYNKIYIFSLLFFLFSIKNFFFLFFIFSDLKIYNDNVLVVEYLINIFKKNYITKTKKIILLLFFSKVMTSLLITCEVEE